MTGRMRPGLLYDESEEEEEEMGVPLPRRRRTDQPEEGMEFEEVSLYHTHTSLHFHVVWISVCYLLILYTHA